MSGHRKLRLVVAEDDYLVGEEIARAIRAMGHEPVGEASNGAEAVEMVCALRPDVVLMDIQMPEVDGLEGTRRIQACCPTPVVALTAHESQELVEKASEAGVSAYLIKPPKATEIERAITIALARHGDLMELRRLNRDIQATGDRLAVKNRELEAKNAELQQALEEVKTLRGILPLCSHCKKIRDDQGYWKRVEVYIRDHTEAQISHGICPDCRKKHYPDLL